MKLKCLGGRIWLLYFLGNTVSHSESCCNYCSPPVSLFLQHKLARNVRSRTNGLVTAVAAALSHRLWPELWAAEGKATGSQLLILSPLSILNGAQVPSKHAFCEGSREPHQNLVLPTLPDRSVNYWNIQSTICQLPQCYYRKSSVLSKGATFCSVLIYINTITISLNNIKNNSTGLHGFGQSELPPKFLTKPLFCHNPEFGTRFMGIHSI